MAFTIPYETNTFRPPNDIIPGNETDPNPVEFDLRPAEGPDLARIKSVVFATIGMTMGPTGKGEAFTGWSPEIQRMVIEAFDSAKGLFDATVTSIRNLSVPYALAVRAGVVPPHDPRSKTKEPDAKSEVPITIGPDFTKVQGFFPGLAFIVAMEIRKLDRETDLDARFFVPPSGSPSKEGTDETATGSATGASSHDESNGTAESPAQTESRPRSISRSKT